VCRDVLARVHDTLQAFGSLGGRLKYEPNRTVYQHVGLLGGPWKDATSSGLHSDERQLGGHV